MVMNPRYICGIMVVTGEVAIAGAEISGVTNIRTEVKRTKKTRCAKEGNKVPGIEMTRNGGGLLLHSAHTSVPHL